ncbi:hypothetical protein C8Q70DRAFT_220505 [Cubamyces menziesii]|nr:hypothetical protein C8Q70DRAFT_220505 [Cubamyces menziesii]
MREPCPQDGVATPPILKVNNDVLIRLAEEVKCAGGALRQFSMTCKRLRMCSMSTLFRACVVNQWGTMTKDSFLPESLWPYVQTLAIRGVCNCWQDFGPSTAVTSPIGPFLCDIYDATMLRNALTAMPGLRAVTLLCPRQANHGLSWDVLQAILAVPQLHQFTCHRYLFSPKATPIDHLVLAGSTSLTSFRYMLNTYRCSPRTHEPEKTALKALLRTHHQVLEVLWMPTESTPWRTICALEWPSLRELRLRGEFDWSGGLLLGALGNMPNLRLLKLDFTLPHNTHPQTIWPQGYNAPYSWPMLEDVQVSFPCPDDHLYARLPLTLCRLSLRFFPHQIVHEWCTRKHQEWHFPSPDAGHLTTLQLP